MTAPAPLAPFPALETERLVLRPLTSADLEFVFHHFSHPEVYAFLLDEAPISTYRQAQDILDFYLQPTAHTYNRWGLARKEDHQLIGTCGYHKWNPCHHRAEIGYDLSPAERHRGYMAEALRAVLRFGFEQLRLHRIEALVYEGNQPSVRLLRKLGFQAEGVLREYFYARGKFHDHWLYSLLSSEWGRTSQ